MSLAVRSARDTVVLGRASLARSSLSALTRPPPGRAVQYSSPATHVVRTAAAVRRPCLWPAVRRLATASGGGSRGGTRPRAGTEVVPFERSQAQGADDFHRWWQTNSPALRSPPLAIRSVLLPFWAFVADVSIPSLGLRRTAVDAPPLQVFAGASFPRSMVEVAKVDLAAARPFAPAMLVAPEGAPVDVEPYVLYEAPAWQLARRQLLAHEAAVWGRPESALGDAVFSGVESHRVLFPVHVVTYTHLGVEFRVIVSGVTGAAFGVEQQSVFGGVPVSRLLERAATLKPLFDALTRLRLPPQLVLALVNGVALLLRPALKLLLWPPLFVGTLLAFSAYATARATASIRTQRTTFAAWEEQRKAEAASQAAMTDDWVFRPRGESVFDRARERAREADERRRATEADERRREREARDAGRGDGGGDGGGRRPAGRPRTSARQPPPPPPPPPPPRGRSPPTVDANDFYAVLGLRRGASEDDVKAAFRRELMTYHPDHAEQSGFDAAACSERTRLIIRAYGTLRDPAKRRAYDGGRA